MVLPRCAADSRELGRDDRRRRRGRDRRPRGSSRGEDLSQLAAGRISAALGTVDVWFAAAAAAVNGNEPLRGLSIRLRSEVVAASRTILDEASRACGSRPFALGSALDRARRDLEIFTLQHRLDPMLIAEGAKLLDPEAG